MTATVETDRKYGLVKANINGTCGDALTTEVLRALAEMRGQEVTVSITAKVAPHEEVRQTGQV
jgi:hypothetical protein